MDTYFPDYLSTDFVIDGDDLSHYVIEEQDQFTRGLAAEWNKRNTCLYRKSREYTLGVAWARNWYEQFHAEALEINFMMDIRNNK